MIVDADAEAVAAHPYRMRSGRHNVTDADPAQSAKVYNAAVQLLDNAPRNYVWQPKQPRVFTTGVIAPGATFWTDDVILVPCASGILDVAGENAAVGKGGFTVKGKGPNLRLPGLPVTALPLRARLLRSDAATCWDSTHSLATKNDATQFKAKSD